MSERLSGPTAHGYAETSPHRHGSAAFIISSRECGFFFVAAMVMRLLWITGPSLRQDEMFAVFWSQRSWQFLLGAGAHIETNPPAYYLFMHVWMRLFGDSVFSVRLPSALASSVMVIIIYVLALMIADRKTARLAGLLAVINPFLVEYGQDARTYALVGLTSGISILALAAALDHRNTPSRRLLPIIATFVLSAVISIYFHFIALLFIAACALVVAIGAVSRRPFDRRWVITWSLAAILIAFGALPGVWLVHQLSGSPDIDWIGPLSMLSIDQFFTGVVFGPDATTAPHHRPALLLLLIILGAAAIALQPNYRRNLVLLALPFCYLVIIVAVSAVRPILLPRIGIFVTIPLILMFANLILAQPKTWQRIAVLIAVAGTSLFFLRMHFANPQNEDWNHAAIIAASNQACGGPLVLQQVFGLGLIYYQPELATRRIYDIPTTYGGKMPAVMVLQQQVTNAPILPPSSLPGFIADHPKTFLINQGGLSGLPENMPLPRYRNNLTGGLLVSCF